jgi:hypothetical protein
MTDDVAAHSKLMRNFTCVCTFYQFSLRDKMWTKKYRSKFSLMKSQKIIQKLILLRLRLVVD